MNSPPNQEPASSSRSSANVHSWTGPSPLVVRSSVSSWMATNRASRESCRSVSMNMAPNSTARRNAAMVFSGAVELGDRKSTRLNSSHVRISYAVFCLKKKKKKPAECLSFLAHDKYKCAERSGCTQPDHIRIHETLSHSTTCVIT